MANQSRQLNIILELQDKASAKLNGFRGKIEEMQPTFQKMAVAGGVAFTGVTLLAKKFVSEASNIEESINAVNVVFGEGAEEIIKFGENSATAVGLARSELNQMATLTGALLKDTGLEMTDVAKRTIELTKRASDMASVFNTDVSDAMSAINQAIRGETEAIRRYAGDVTDATLEQYLLSEGINKSVKELTEQEKRLYRVDLIMKQTEVTSGDFANTSDSLANKMKILKAQFKDIGGTIGSELVPRLTKALESIEPIIEKIIDWIKENPKLASNILLVTGAIAGLVAIAGALGLILPVIISGFIALTSPITLIAIAIALLIALFIRFKDDIISFFVMLDEKLGIMDFFKAKWEELKIVWEEQLKPALAGLIELFKTLSPILKVIFDVVKLIAKIALVLIIEAFKIFIDTLVILIDHGSRIFKFFTTLGGKIEKVTDFIDRAIDRVEKLIEKFRELGVIRNLRERARNIVENVADAISVNDAVITPSGQVIKTNPADYLFATKTPEDLMKSGGGNTINININGGIFGSDAGEEIGNMIIERLGLVAKL